MKRTRRVNWSKGFPKKSASAASVLTKCFICRTKTVLKKKAKSLKMPQQFRFPEHKSARNFCIEAFLCPNGSRGAKRRRFWRKAIRRDTGKAFVCGSRV